MIIAVVLLLRLTVVMDLLPVSHCCVINLSVISSAKVNCSILSG